MRVFVTGATGFVGMAVVRELIGAKHQVLGLARSDAGAEALKKAGAEVHRGDMEQPETLASGAREADAVIHLAFNHDFSKFAENGAEERRAIAAIGEAMAPNKVLLVTSGTGLTSASGRPATEDDEPAGGDVVPRTPEAAARAFEGRLRVGVVRLPQVHDTRKAGLVSFIVSIARQKGFVGYAGDGSNGFPAAHVTDVARLYRLALEKTDGFTRYHAVAEEGVPLRAISDVLGKGLRLPVRSVAPEETAAYFGWMAHFASHDMRASSDKTRRALGWSPTGPGLIDDLSKLEWV